MLSFKHAISAYHHTDLSKQREKTIIAPYWADADTSKGGEIWYRLSTNATDLQYATANARISFQENLDFESKWTLVVTWNNVGYFGRSKTYSHLVGTAFLLHVNLEQGKVVLYAKSLLDVVQN